MSYKLLVTVILLGAELPIRTAARVKSLLACLHLSYRRIGVEVKVILQRVERLENIGKVRGEGELLFPFRQQDAYGMDASKEVPCRIFVGRA